MSTGLPSRLPPSRTGPRWTKPIRVVVFQISRLFPSTDLFSEGSQGYQDYLKESATYCATILKIAFARGGNKESANACGYFPPGELGRKVVDIMVRMPKSRKLHFAKDCLLSEPSKSESVRIVISDKNGHEKIFRSEIGDRDIVAEACARQFVNTMVFNTSRDPVVVFAGDKMFAAINRILSGNLSGVHEESSHKCILGACVFMDNKLGDPASRFVAPRHYSHTYALPTIVGTDQIKKIQEDWLPKCLVENEPRIFWPGPMIR